MRGSKARNRAMVASAAAAMLMLTACQGDGGEGGETDAGGDDPIVIGISLPLTGDFAEPGQGVQRGYELWRDMVNESGGLLGRQVELRILDDQSNADRVVADYETLITQDEVDLIAGPFSSRLVLPAGQVAEDYNMLFVEPAGAANNIFEAGYRNLFYAAPAIGNDHYNYLFDWIQTLPEDERPQTASYAVMDDPLASSAAEGLRENLESIGVETLVHEVYPPNTTDFSGIGAAVADADADLLVGGTQYQDAMNLIQAVRQLGYQPRMAAFTTAPTLPEFHEALGDAAEGVLAPTGYSPTADYPGNAEFVERIAELYDREPSEDEANAYTVGQVLQTVVEAVGCAEQGECQTQLVDWLHENSVPTVVGELAWDEAGRPNGAHFILQWIDGQQQVVLPADAADTEIVFPKPEW